MVVRIDRDPGPHVADAPHRAHLFGQVLRLGIHEGPNLFALDALGLEVAQGRILVPLTGFAHVYQELGYRVDGHVRESARGAEAVALDQHS